MEENAGRDPERRETSRPSALAGSPGEYVGRVRAGAENSPDRGGQVHEEGGGLEHTFDCTQGRLALSLKRLPVSAVRTTAV